MARRDTNPLAGIDTRFTPLSTKVADYDFYSGAINSVKGIIDKYQEKQEASSFDKLQQTIDNLAMDGKVDDIRALASTTEQFSDPTRRKAARDTIISTHDNLATSMFETAINRAKQTGDEEGLVNLSLPKTFNPILNQKAAIGLQTALTDTKTGNLSLALQKSLQTGDVDTFKAKLAEVDTLPVSVDTKAKIHGQYASQLPGLVINSGLKNTLNQYNQDFDKSNATNIEASTSTFKSNPEFAKYFEIIGGQLIPKNIDVKNTTEVAKQEKLEKDFYSQAVSKGATARVGDIDSAVNKLRSDLIAQNIPYDQVNKAVETFATEASRKSQLGPQMQAEQTRQHSIIDSEAAASLEKLDAQYKIKNKFTDAQLTQALGNAKYTPSNLASDISKEYPNTFIGSFFSGKNDGDEIKEKVTGLLGKEYAIGGKVVKPTPYQLKQTLDLLKTSFWHSNKAAVDNDSIENVLQKVMAEDTTSPAQGVALPLQQLEEYYKERKAIQSDATARKLKSTSRLMGSVGLGENKDFFGVEPTKTTDTVKTNSIKPNIKPKFTDADLTDGQIPNNNVGNLKDAKTGKIRVFDTPEEGVVAVKKQLLSYMTKGSPINGEKITNIKGIIDNWRPASDRRGNTDISQENYYKTVSDILNIGIEDPIQPTDNVLNKLTEAIAKVEHGKKIKLGS